MLGFEQVHLPPLELLQIEAAIYGDMENTTRHIQYLRNRRLATSEDARNHYNIVCRHHLKGMCKQGDGCEFLHSYDLSKMPSCQFFFSEQGCSSADKV
jgi:hypothetical protein